MSKQNRKKKPLLDIARFDQGVAAMVKELIPAWFTMYRAGVDAGFSEEQAMLIVLTIVKGREIRKP